LRTLQDERETQDLHGIHEWSEHYAYGFGCRLWVVDLAYSLGVGFGRLHGEIAFRLIEVGLEGWPYLL
jgi:hypothetical protein